MKISEVGGEFALIPSLIKRQSLPGGKEIVVAPGDDASVLQFGDQLLAVTVDAFLEGTHFSFDYFQPESVGKRVIEASASDIIAMGGTPSWFWITLGLPSETPVAQVESIYDGMYAAATRFSATIQGGETIAHSAGIFVSVTALGIIQSIDAISQRRDAKPGDLVCVTGTLGGSAAGLLLLQNKIEGFHELKQKHLEPRCRYDIVGALAGNVNAMIDISDGLASELHHIARASNVSIQVRATDIPVPETLKAAADLLGTSPSQLALSGGEDFELLYTIPANATACPGTVIGSVLEGSEKVELIQADGTVVSLAATGYNHFR